MAGYETPYPWASTWKSIRPNFELQKDSDKINIYYGTSLGRISKLELEPEVESQRDLSENEIEIDYNEGCKNDNPSVKQMILNGTDLIVSFDSLIVTKGLQCETCR